MHPHWHRALPGRFPVLLGGSRLHPRRGGRPRGRALRGGERLVALGGATGEVGTPAAVDEGGSKKLV